ncbi:MAG: LOG family protein [Pseudomonadota bacterium]
MESEKKIRKAYENSDFLRSREGRSLRILSEFAEPQARFERLGLRDTIVMFGSARVPSAEEAQSESCDKSEDLKAMSRYYEAARLLARRLSEWSMSLEDDPGRYVICTGGGPGIMEAANRGAREVGARTAGLTISLPREEFENTYVSEELAFEFHYFFMRKFWFTYLAKAVIAMPGGFGTLDELFELLTLVQTNKMKKQIPIVLFGSEFWDEVFNLETMVRHGTINKEDLNLFYRTDSVDAAYDYITDHLINGPPETGPVL